ncbi:hypothetical protein [Nocardia goodfellowii]|uniref:Tetratricopeptide (TPR) repeat protein n=1 Tax=Nocardia goodfellowii TaxID=882446 RepID=A0ABS4QGP6_9NOCA|nr:hypothetical protein [Nocardia goodfellowii]MBP2190879.1 tetratricopeptide (TPR) repeat protein [Nocardia goodfellowii]
MERPADATPAIGAGRSPITEGLAVSAAVGVSGAAKIFGDWMVDSVGKSPAFVFLGQLLSWLWWVLPLLGAGWWLYAFVTDRRERSRVARELELIEQLVPPGPAVSMSGGHQCPSAPDLIFEEMDQLCLTMARLLHTLPLREYDSAALLAMVGAVVEVLPRVDVQPRATPQNSIPAVTAKYVLDRLVTAHVLRPGGPHGYCVHKGLWSAQLPSSQSSVQESIEQMRNVAVSVLLEYWAQVTGRWAIALGTQELAVGARRWFEGHHGYLLELVGAFARFDPLPYDAVPSLARLVDALDVWNAALGKEEFETQIESFVPRPVNFLDQLAEKNYVWMRAGRLNERPRFYNTRALAPGNEARKLHREALDQIGTDTCNWEQTVEKLEKAWWRLPRKDLAGEVCIAINLAIAHIVQGRFEAAAAQIELAETLARRGDPGGLAHVFEIYGALYWARGEERRAFTAWQYALEQYRALADDLGAGRCQQHIGRALLAAPRYAGVLMEPEPGTELTEDNVRSHAHARLDEASALRSRPPDASPTGSPPP